MTARERLLARLAMCPGAYDPARDAALIDAVVAEVRADERAKALADAADEAARHNHCTCNNAHAAAHAIRRIAAQPTQEQP